MKNKPNHLFFGLYSLLCFTAFAGNKDANQMIHSASKDKFLFEENKGQIKDQNWQPRPDVLFSSETKGLVHHILSNGISYQISKVESMKPAEEHFRKGGMPGSEVEMIPDQIGIYRVDVRWVNSNPKMEIIKTNPSKDYNNYYNVPEGVEPALFVRKYENITLKNIWQGIDLEYYSKEGVLESDWIVHQASDLDKIKFTIKGANLSLDSEGNLVMQTPYGTIKEGGLKVFQSGKTLEASWKLNGEEVSFSVKNFNPELPIKIDPPTRLWGTYYGGSENDYAYSIATDKSGNVLITGFAYSSNAIATNGAYQTNIGGVTDVFIVQFDTSGVRHWGTYYGGSDGDLGFGITTDFNGNVLVTGSTYSTNAIATFGAYQMIKGGLGEDAFIVKFDFYGTCLWGTYYGGNDYDVGNDIVTDISGNVVVIGSTSSTNALSTSGTHQTILGGSVDAFILKFDSNGNRIWCTYLGGSNGDFGTGITTDILGNILAIGYTSSTNAIATIGVHQPNFGGGSSDAFIIKFDTSGICIWGSYYGSSELDEGYGISTDLYNNVLVIGLTEGNNAIASNGAYDVSLDGNRDAFIAKFTASGNRLWGTFYGGNDLDEGYGIASDISNNVLVTGTTSSTSDISTSGAHQINRGGYYDAFVVKFDSLGSRIWGTYYGGNSYDGGNDIATDTLSNVLVTGYTYSVNSISSSNAHQTNLNGSYSGFVVKFQDNTTTSIFPETHIPFSATLFPNPTLEESYLQILAESTAEMLLEISDLNGRVLSKTNESILPGENCIRLNVQDFIPGIYFVTLTIDGFTQTLKFCKE